MQGYTNQWPHLPLRLVKRIPPGRHMLPHTANSSRIHSDNCLSQHQAYPMAGMEDPLHLNIDTNIEPTLVGICGIISAYWCLTGQLSDKYTPTVVFHNASCTPWLEWRTLCLSTFFKVVCSDFLICGFVLLTSGMHCVIAFKRFHASSSPWTARPQLL